MSHDPSSDPTISSDHSSTDRPFDHPEKVGPYRILQVIGEGGMGIVYAAEQTEPIRRRVALKMMKVGMDTKEVVARFETERQALAVMDHPNIAKVLDAGATESGRPYFVMEHVQGIPLTDYCDRHQLSVRQRLELFIVICRAVQHAHQKGVIHRDLKPSNLLVSEREGKPFPRIIDFGIAKAIAQQLTRKTLVTVYGQAMGTPAYMSPEQAEMSGLDVDTRADIYSLGVMLYELLVGHLPTDPKDLGMLEFLSELVKRETDPPTPSTRLVRLGGDGRTVARARATDRRSLTRQLKGDLDWIVMKAMASNRTRRYDTATELADDLGRYLAHEPVAARAPSASYKVRKFVRRHTAGVSFAIVLTLLVLGFAVTMAIQARMIALARDAAELEAAKARTVSDFMRDTLLAPDPEAGLGRDVTIAEALGTAAAKLDQAFPEQPSVEATARSAIGWAYFQLGRYDDAEPLLRRALEIRRETLGPRHADLAESLDQWASLRQARADYEAAESFFRQALAMRREALGERHPAVAASLQNLAAMLSEVGRFGEAEVALGDALAVRALQGENTLEYASLQNEVGIVLWNQGKYEELEPLWLEVLERHIELLGREHPLVGTAMNNLAVLYDNTGRREEAERYYREALEIIKRTRGPDHEEVSATMSNLAILLDTAGRHDEAERLHREALRIDRQQLGNDHPAVANDLANLAVLLCEQDGPSEGLRLVDEAMAIFTAVLEPGDWRLGQTHQWRGRCLARLGRYDDAESELLQGHEILHAALGADHWRTARSRQRLAELYQAWGKPDRAAEYASSDDAGNSTESSAR